MQSSFFITATGTDQGKTTLTTALCYQLQQQGKRVQALKPVISGYDGTAQTDTVRIIQSLSLPLHSQTIEEISPWRFSAPISPDEAARREGGELFLPEIVAFCHQPREADYLFIEGAGGVMSPLSAAATNLDLIAALKLPVILVSSSYLGCVSHILAALAALKARGVDCQHLALLQVSPDMQSIALTLSSLLPHLQEGMRVAQVNHLASNTEIWKNAPDLTKWLENK